MMSSADLGKKLDLSKLTDEEATHVWQVVRRDFDLRKKEEDRLGDLKTKIEKEDTKRELLGTQTSLSDSLCIRCLQPFKFLVNSKRQCLDCQLFTCKACSRYNKKERGWVCDPCRMARVLKIGTLEWYHENVRSRFKRFGSAKVMRSLFKRLRGDDSGSQNDLRVAPEEDTQSTPEVHNAFVDHTMDPAGGQHYRSMKKTKRLLTVDPFDFDDPNYSTHSRRQSYQDVVEGGARDSAVTAAEVTSMFQRILEEQGDMDPDFTPDLHLRHRRSLDKAPRYDEGVYPELRMTRSRSLSRLRRPPSGNGPFLHRGEEEEEDEEEEEEEDEEQDYQRRPSHRSPAWRRRSLASHEGLSQAAPPQMAELNKRMSAVEGLLSRLEQKVPLPCDQGAVGSGPAPQWASVSSGPAPPWASVGSGPAPPWASVGSGPAPQWASADFEELQLRRKLDQMTGNLSDHGLTSEEDETPLREGGAGGRGRRRLPGGGDGPVTPTSATPPPSVTPLSGPGVAAAPPTEDGQGSPEGPKDRLSTGKLLDPERKVRPLEDGSYRVHYRGSTASVLFELEDKVAQAAASVQSTLSEMSEIETRIAALGAAGMPVDKTRRKSAIPAQSRRDSNDFPTSQTDTFARNSVYRGSLTQRNPGAKPKRRPACAKPVMAQGP